MSTFLSTSEFLLKMFSLIALNAFCVLAEFVAVSVPLVQLERESEHSENARRLHAVLTNATARDRYLVVAQLGITLASLLLGFFSERTMAEMFAALAEYCGFTIHEVALNSVSAVLALLLITYLHAVLGEMVPKRLAIENPMRYVGIVEPVMRIAGWIFFPLSWFLNDCISHTVLRVCNLPINQDMESYTKEDLRMALEESHERGVLDEEYNDWCQSLFELKERTLRTVMTPRVKVVGISKDATIDEALAIVTAEGYSRYPIYEGDLDHIVGLIHVRDLFKAQWGGREVTMDALKRHCERLPEVLELNVALDKMRSKAWHMVAVVDEFGGIAGIATLEDIVEAVVGEVFDEFDAEEEEPIDEVSEGVWEIDGSVMLEDIGEEFDVKLERDEVYTVAGLIMDQLERLPKVHDKVTIEEGLEFEVIEVADMVPKRCRVRRVAPTKSGEVPAVVG